MYSLPHKIIQQYQQKLPFVVYRKPNSTKSFAFFMPDVSLIYSKNFKEQGFVFSPFKSEEDSILFPLKKALFLSEELQLEPEEIKENKTSIKTSSQEQHIFIVDKAIKEIQNSSLQKVVISREELIDVSSFDILKILQKLLHFYKNAFVYVWFHPKVGLWFGASPETLLFIENSTFTTMSLAGTQLYKSKIKPIWKSKELEEQQLVTDFIEDQLKNIANNLKIDKTETIKAGNLLHLRTKVSGDLNRTSSLEELIRALHPTPAVCGLPRDIARDFILKNEQYSRSYYTGFLGELNISNTQESSPKTDLYVNLRCMKIEDSIASVFVGGGITKDSVAVNEWEETVSKALTMKRVL